MATFEERLARLSAESAGLSPQGAGTPGPVIQDQAFQEREAGTPQTSGLSLPLVMLGVPLALALGAGSVVVGGVVQVALLDGGVTRATTIPPQLGFVALGIALVLSFIADRIVRVGHLGVICVTLGFVGMVFGEGYLAQTFPEIWQPLYEAKYLAPVLTAVGL